MARMGCLRLGEFAERVLKRRCLEKDKVVLETVRIPFNLILYLIFNPHFDISVNLASRVPE
jgi:hypothetical protein